MGDAFVVASARTPFGRYGGALAGLRPDDLAATALTALLARVPGVDPAEVEDVVWGCANQAGEDNRNVGRMAVLLAGLPTSVPATTINRLCGSSLDAAIVGSRAIESGDADAVVVGGVESMSRAPWVLPKPERAYPAGPVPAVSTTLGWRLVNERMPAEWTVSLGECNEQLAERFHGTLGRLVATRTELGHIEEQLAYVLKMERDEQFEKLTELTESYESTRRKIEALENIRTAREQAREESNLMDLLSSKEPGAAED